jgi:hypothetical protein
VAPGEPPKLRPEQAVRLRLASAAASVLAGALPRYRVLLAHH